MQGTLPQNQSLPWAQKSDHRCMPDAPDRYLERPVQAGALFRKGLSCRQVDRAFHCYLQGRGPGSTSQAGLHFQGRTRRRVRLKPCHISVSPQPLRLCFCALFPPVSAITLFQTCSYYGFSPEVVFQPKDSFRVMVDALPL